MESIFKKAVWLTLAFIYLIMIAGSVVRTTGSGMGCPDWPKCFGYLIPPTSESEVIWQENHDYQEGQMIIIDNDLLIAPQSFQSGISFNSSNWETYDKHDYAKFNVVHTWVEYINRLCTVVSGFPVVIMVFSSLFLLFRDKKKWPFITAFSVLFLFGFEAWLGKMVVDGHLIPMQITLHLVAALVIALILLFMVAKNKKRVSSWGVTSTVRYLIIAAIILSICQFTMGTQVREVVDAIVKSGNGDRSSWIEQMTSIFPIHRSFSWLVVIINVWIASRLRKAKSPLFKPQRWVLILIAVEILLGIGLSKFGFPHFAQPSHLIVAVGIISFQWWMVITSKIKTID